MYKTNTHIQGTYSYIYPLYVSRGKHFNIDAITLCVQIVRYNNNNQAIKSVERNSPRLLNSHPFSSQSLKTIVSP